MMCPPYTRPDYPLVYAVVVIVAMLVGIYPTVMAALMVRRRRLVLSKDGKHVLEGRAALITGSVVLGLIAVADLISLYALTCSLYWS